MDRKNWDDILKPYEDEQPDSLSMKTTDGYSIQRIPPLVDANGISREFQEFFNKVVNYITHGQVDDLYTISDKAMSCKEFIEAWNCRIGNQIAELLEMPVNKRGFDIELNINRFKQIHRNLIGGFFIIMYKLEDEASSMLKTHSCSLIQQHTEILFTYKDGFKLISKISPFQNSDSNI